MSEPYRDEVLYSVAKAIADKCPNCPCFEECRCKEEYIEDCVDRIYFWLDLVAKQIDWDKIFWEHQSINVPESIDIP